jgi:hypothetical protein
MRYRGQAKVRKRIQRGYEAAAAYLSSLPVTG